MRALNTSVVFAQQVVVKPERHKFLFGVSRTGPKRERETTTKHTLIVLLLHPNCDKMIPLAHSRAGTFRRPSVPPLCPAPLDTPMLACFWLQNGSQVRRENWFHYMIAMSAVLLATGMD